MKHALALVLAIAATGTLIGSATAHPRKASMAVSQTGQLQDVVCVGLGWAWRAVLTRDPDPFIRNSMVREYNFI